MAKMPLILIPGLLNDAALWAHQAETLADIAEVRVADVTQDDSLPAMARRIIAAAPARFSMAGLSMGGYVAQEIMRQAPERVDRLALLDTAARADLPEQKERRMVLIAEARAGNFDGVAPQLLPMLVHSGHVEPLRETVIGMARRVGPEAFIRQQTAIMGRPDGRADLERIACPVLILVGRQDAITPAKVAEEMVSRLPRPRLVVIEDCGHLAPIEQPHAVSAVLRYWLSDS